MPRQTLLTPPSGSRRQGAALLLTLAVVAGHLVGLGAAPGPAPAPPQVPSAGLQLRLLAPPAHAPRVPLALPTPTPALRSEAAARAPALAAAAVLPSSTGAVARQMPDPAPASAPARAMSTLEREAQAIEPPSTEASEAPPWPTYAAVLPPAATRHYQLQRGGRSSPARLSWAPHAQGYQLSLMAEGGDLDGLGAVSQGHVGPAGLVPERHVERRRGRDQRATNFDMATGQVRGSGGGEPHPWPAGGQDRLSWLLQLAAVLQADAMLARPGARVVLAVAGPRGPPATWVFQVRGPDSVTLADGQSATALALQRDAQHAYDLQVEVWLDPADHHLPLRLRLSAPPGEWESVWLLRSKP